MEIGIDPCTQCMYSTVTSSQYSKDLYLGKESKKEWVYVSLIHFEANTLQVNYTPIKINLKN